MGIEMVLQNKADYTAAGNTGRMARILLKCGSGKYSLCM
jgi:hypothetical protein